MADRVVMIHQGRVIAESTMEDLAQSGAGLEEIFLELSGAEPAERKA